MRLRAFLLGLVLFCVAAPASAATKIQRVESPGGVVAWLVEDHRIPIVAMQFAFRGGAALDPGDKAGLSRLTAQLLDEGAGELDSQAMQTRLEDLSITLGFSSGEDAFSGWVKTLSENRAQAFDLLRLSLTQPRFDQEAIERIRAAHLNQLKRRSNEPDYLAGRLWWRQALRGHPYAQPSDGTLETVPRITADDMRAFVRTRFARDNLVIGVVGDITSDDLRRTLTEVFDPLPAAAASWAVPQAAPQARGIAVIERPVPQSVVVFGEKGIKRDDADWFPAFVLNHILGGGVFSSRLYQEIREKRGLAYSVYTYLDSLEGGGFIFGGVSTQNSRVAESIEVIRQEWRKLAETPPTDKQIAEAKAYLTGSFPLQFDSTEKMARLLVSMQLDRLGIDYLERRSGLINAVTPADLVRVARRILDADALLFAVVGQPSNLAGAEKVPGVD